MVEHRFERDGIVSIAYNGDCMEGMKMFEDRRFDLACVDPPYGIGEDGRKSQSRRVSSRKWKCPSDSVYIPKTWDDSPMPPEYFHLLFEISIKRIVWGANHFIDRIPFASPCWLIWKKNGQNENCDFADCEIAWTNFKSAVRLFDYAWTGFGAKNSGEVRIHPTQKPVALYKWIFKNYAKEGQWVIDTHLGSQSSRIAAYEAGLNFIGFELDEDYFKQGCERFDWHVKQLKLF